MINYSIAKQLWSLATLHSDYGLKIVDGLDFLSNHLTIVVIRMKDNCIALYCHHISCHMNRFV